MSINLITSLLIGLFVFVLSLYVIVFFIRFPLALFGLILVEFVVETILSPTALKVTIGVINVYVLDILSVFALMVASARLFLIKLRPRISLLLILAISVLLLIAWLRGVPKFGLESATNSLRPYFYFFATLLLGYSLVNSSRYLYIYFSLLVVVGWAMIIIAIIRLTFVILGIASSPDWIASGGLMARVLFAPQAFYLFQILIINRYARLQGWKMPFSKYLTIIFLPILLILQHRTVWVSLLVAVLIMLILESKVKVTVFVGLLIGGIFTFLLIIWLNLHVSSFTDTVFDLHNFIWRILGWQSLFDPSRYKASIDYFIGQPLGTGYARYLPDANYAVTVNPHNFYIQTFLNIGGLGLLVLLIYYGYAYKNLWPLRGTPMGKCMIVLLLSQLVLFMTYPPNYEQGFLLGVAVLFGTRTQNERRPT